MQKLYKDRREKTILILLVIYAVVVFMFDADEANLRLIYAAYLILCIGLLFAIKRIFIFKESAFLVFYWLFGVLSLLWAVNFNTALIRVKTVVALVVFLLLLTSYIVKIQKPIFLLIALAAGTVALSGYMFYRYGVSGVIEAIQAGEDRLGDLINNVNAIANSMVVGMLAIIGFAIFYKKRLLLLLLVPIGICFLAAGSRTATISLIVGVLILIAFRLKTEKNLPNRFFFLILAVATILMIWVIIRDIPAMEKLVLRLENLFVVWRGEKSIVKEGSVQMRRDYIRLGWNQFLKSPIWGNGIGCAGYAIKEKYGYVTYLHNNYIEILASGGIIGFVLYYAPYILTLIAFSKRIFKHHEKNPVLLISFVLLIAKLIGHMGTVMYYSKIEYLLLALWISIGNSQGAVNEQKQDSFNRIE